MKNRSLFFAALTLVLAACGPGELSVRDAWARPALQGGTGAVYLTLQNGTNELVTLIGASTDLARVVEMHTSMMMNDEAAHHGEGHPTASPVESDVATMHPVGRIELAAGGSVILAPGGYHIMLIDLQRTLVAGETFTATLHFDGHADLDVEVEVVSP